MSQNLVYDFLVLNAPVRRIGNDLDRPAAPTANLDIDVEDAREIGPGLVGIPLY